MTFLVEYIAAHPLVPFIVVGLVVAWIARGIFDNSGQEYQRRTWEASNPTAAKYSMDVLRERLEASKAGKGGK